MIDFGQAKDKLPYKGYGRIYCESGEHVKEVETIIEKIVGAFEFSYMPEGIVAPFSEYPKVVYTHKFDDWDTNNLTAYCWKRGIKIWVFDAGKIESPSDLSDKLYGETES